MNRLQYESSPYLRLHKTNPVDWYPWGEEAFEKARAEDKPIFLSIGYSTCHWCHVMEEESFADPEVAALLNESFVSIKVDREERPDIDGVYMTVSQVLTGRGGWPLTIIMTAEKQPFWSATYIPKESVAGRMGMMDLFPTIKELWDTDRERLVGVSGEIQDILNQINTYTSQGDINSSIFQTAFNEYKKSFDAIHGGFGSAPKFPTPANILFLLGYWKESKDDFALEMAVKTLDAMSKGGIYDHIGFGFHRYSTDEGWKLPHFEKMLYDQALIAMAYTEAYQATGFQRFKTQTDEILTYVKRELTSPKGGFYSAEDADSEGEEGTFYIWSETELRDLLSPEEFEFVITNYNILSDGNYLEESTGRKNGTMFYINREISVETKDSLKDTFEPIREKLFSHREKRVHPLKDDKILTDWNGLMIAAYAKAGAAFNNPEYLKTAERAAGFIFSYLKNQEGRLLHRYREGEAGIEAFAADYAFFIWGLIETYLASYDTAYLREAIVLNNIFEDYFRDEDHGGYFTTAEDGETLIVRDKNFYDGALPAANSAALYNLLRLGRLTGNRGYEQQGRKISSILAEKLNEIPTAFGLSLTSLGFLYGTSTEIVLVGHPEKDDTQKMIEVIRGSYNPKSVVIFKDPANPDDARKVAPFTKVYEMVDGKATVYVCSNFICKEPTNDTVVLEEILAGY